ncbi:MAG: ABC transporter permease, partial [Coleofasciculaceae cyanobacterium SM2_3_26]|nr:ABC transporter permease [Coleofasciculaceae cyanobacterium SM2_3_26]
MTTQESTPDINKPNGFASLVQSDTLGYIIKRLAQGMLTLLLASALCFAIIQLAPGSYIDVIKENPSISKETIDQLIAEFGLDKPPVEQYFHWLQQVVLHGDFGRSMVYQRPATDLLVERIPATCCWRSLTLVLTWRR